MSATFNLGSLFNSLINTGGGLYADLLNQQLVTQLMGGKVNVLNNLNGLQGNAQSNISGIQPGLTSLLQNEGLQGGLALNSDQSSLMNYLTGSANGVGLNGLDNFTNMINPASVPGLSSYMGQVGGEQNTLGTQAGNAFNILGQGLGSGQQGLSTAGNSLLSGNTANSAFQNLLQNYATQTLNNGGYTSPLNTVTSEGNSLLAQNPTAASAGNLAQNIFGLGTPVLPTSEVVSMALNQNATNSQQQENALMQQEYNRTGTTGPAVASGSTDSLLNNMQDQVLQNQSSALQNALLSQQSLGLQQLGSGTNLLNAATGANLGYTGQGLNALLQGQSQATTNENVLGQLGLGGGSLGLNTLATGGNLLNALNSSELGGLNTGNSLMQTLNSVNQGLANTSLGTQQLGLSQLEGQYGALNSLLGQGNTMSGQALQEMLGSSNSLNSILGDYISQLTSGGTAQVGLYSGIPSYPSNIYQNLTSGGGGSLFGLTFPTSPVTISPGTGGGGGGTSPFGGFPYDPFAGLDGGSGGSTDPFGGSNL